MTHAAVLCLFVVILNLCLGSFILFKQETRPRFSKCERDCGSTSEFTKEF